MEEVHDQYTYKIKICVPTAGIALDAADSCPGVENWALATLGNKHGKSFNL